jgi:signal peptidase I
MPDHSNTEKITSDTIITLWSDLHHHKQKLWLPVLSGSMTPLLLIGDMVLVESISPENIKLGDIIVFKDFDKLVVHRVIQKYKDGSKSFLQKGDNARIAEIVMSENIIGRVTAVQKGTKVISLNFWVWKMYNYILTFISWSSYSHKPENLVLRRITKLFYKIIKWLLNWM